METQLHLPHYDELLLALDELSKKKLPEGQFKFDESYPALVFLKPRRLFQQPIVLEMDPALQINSKDQRNDHSLKRNINFLAEEIEFELRNYPWKDNVEVKLVKKCLYSYLHKHFMSPTISIQFPVGKVYNLPLIKGITGIKDEVIFQLFDNVFQPHSKWKSKQGDGYRIMSDNNDIIKNFSRVKNGTDVFAVIYLHIPVNFNEFQNQMISRKKEDIKFRGGLYRLDENGDYPSWRFWF